MDLHKDLSDSEDDGDYIPPAEDGSGSDSEIEEPTKSTGPENGGEKGSKDLKEIWQSFEASIPTTSSSKCTAAEEKTVKVVKRYRFAGQEQEEIIEVPESSEEARKWPVYRAPDHADAELGSEPTVTLQSAVQQPSEQSGTRQPPPKRKPGPRKPKTTLAPLPSTSKAKKITTLEKSAMDWKAHLDSQKQSGVQDELEANRRGGGYLEKVEFLQRVGERKEDKLEAERSTKRRKL